MRTCGTCKYWIPETTGLIAQAKAKHPWPHCSLNGETKTEEDKPCLAWTGRKGELSTLLLPVFFQQILYSLVHEPGLGDTGFLG